MRKLLVLALCCFLWGCGGGKKVALKTPTLSEPDKDLYATARKELDHSHYDRARLLLQTLINTYPDSEYLPQAMYASAESFYREGTKSMLNQADTEFRNYITFFPITDLADDAQLMVAMTHVRQMEKADRDPTQARLAEMELKKLIKEYADSQLLDEAKQKLRDVQEVLAENVNAIGKHYYIRRAYPAAASRYKEVLDKYPDYSRIDDTLFYFAESLRRTDHGAEAGQFYAQIVRDHPFSSRVPDAKSRLKELNQAIPEPNPVAIARTQEGAPGRSMFGRVFGLIRSRPAVSTETSATSIRDEPVPETNPGTGGFSIEPKVVPPK